VVKIGVNQEFVNIKQEKRDIAAVVVNGNLRQSGNQLFVQCVQVVGQLG
jgi:phage terminase large subunit-like protein